MYWNHSGQSDLRKQSHAEARGSQRIGCESSADASEVCPSFDELFFPVLKEVLPEDGQIGLDEQFYLLKMLDWDGTVRNSEKQFLRELKSEAKTITPEFEQLFETAFNANPTNWDVGGRYRLDLNQAYSER